MHSLIISGKLQSSFLARYLFILLCTTLCFGFLFLTPLCAQIATHQIQVSFSFDTQVTPGKQVTGYRFFKEGLEVCSSGIVEPQVINCTLESEEGTFDFTLSALYDDESESPQSAPFSFTLAAQNETQVLSAEISADVTAGEIPFTLTLDGSNSTGDIISYEWTFGANNHASGPSAQNTYESPGVYTVTLTVRDSVREISQKSIQITATAPAVPNRNTDQPQAVISSSAAIGEAPLTVEFSSAKSLHNSQRSIVSSRWKFGDGSRGKGTIVSHKYTKPGKYTVKLRVTDSLGRRSITSTPIIITSSPIKQNEPPTAVIGASQALGNAPLTVSFDGTESSDRDGNIANYHWTINGISSSTGLTDYTFDAPGDYNVKLKVTDNEGEETLTTTTISVIERDEIIFAYELGEIEINHEWSFVEFSQPFNAPVVVAGPPTYNGNNPLTVRVRNLTQDGFEIRLQEWDYLDGYHAYETLSYFVMEQGTFTLPDGSLVEAGTFTGSSTLQAIQLQQSYNTSPVIISQVISEDNQRAVTGRLKKINTRSFNYKLQEEEKTKDQHPQESVAYIAWQPGSGFLAELHYEVGITPDTVDHNWFTQEHISSTSEAPFFITDMQSANGGDTATLRMKNHNPLSTRIKVEEEQSKDSEVTHPSPETIGFVKLRIASDVSAGN